MSTNEAFRGVKSRLGEAKRQFRCCDTRFEVHVSGFRADAAVEEARKTAISLETELNPFEEGTAVSRLNRVGEVENPHVAELVRRGEEYRDRTNGAFDIRHGDVENQVKSYVRGETDTAPEIEGADGCDVSVNGDYVTTDGRIDLNGLAKGYIVDSAYSALSGFGRSGFVNGGGDMTPPSGVVSIESPYEEDTPLKYLDTDGYVATSGGYRRRRGGTDHIYGPRSGRTGARHDSVTVVAERDCVEADALATAVSALSLCEGLELISRWSGAEALVVHGGVFHETDGFEKHVYEGGRDG